MSLWHGGPPGSQAGHDPGPGPRRLPPSGARGILGAAGWTRRLREGAPLVLQGPSIFSGNGHPQLAEEICAALDQPLGQANVFAFSNENIFVQICENVRERDVFVVQPGASPVNTNFMELLIMIDALHRASAARVTAVIPYYPYGRSDKKDQPRVPITARLVANLLETAGANRVLTVDLHAGQIQGFFNIPTDELTALYLFGRHFEEQGFQGVVVAPDLGSAKRARNLAERLDTPLALCEKRRATNSDRAEILHLIGDVRGQDALIVDDEVDTAGTLEQVAHLLKDQGALDIYAACTHGVLSGPAIDRIAGSPLKSLTITDTLPLPPHKRIDKIHVLPLASLIGEAIRRIHSGRSVGALFQ